MQTITVEITDINAIKALQDLQEKQFIKILSHVDLNSPVFPGEALTENEFQQWVSIRENANTLSLSEAKSEWVKKREILLQP